MSNFVRRHLWLTSVLLLFPLGLIAQRPQETPARQDAIEKQADLEFWLGIKDKGRIDLFELYLKEFPNGRFAPIARVNIQELRDKAASRERLPIDLASLPSAETSPATTSDVSDPAVLLKKVRAALGGQEKIAAIRNWERIERGSGRTAFGEQKKSKLLTDYWCATGQMRSNGYGQEFFDGTGKGWVFIKGRARELNPAEVRVYRRKAFYEFLNLITADLRKDLKVTVDKPLQLRIRDADGNVARLEIEGQGFRPVRFTRISENPERPLPPQQIVFADWRTVDGISLPFRLHGEFSDQPIDLIVSEWKLNTRVRCDELARTPGNVPISPSMPAKGQQIGASPLESAVAPDRDTSQDALALLQKVQEGVGGVNRLLGAKDYRRVFLERYPQADSTKMKKTPKVVESWCDSGAVLRHVSVPLLLNFGSFFDGKDAGWIKKGSKWAVMTPAMVEEEKRNAFEYDFFGILLADRRPGSSLSLLNESMLQIIDQQGSVMRIEVDPATHLPRKRIGQYFGRKAISDKNEEHFANWKPVNGILLPFSLVEYRRGRIFREVEVLNWSINTGVDCANLGKR